MPHSKKAKKANEQLRSLLKELKLNTHSNGLYFGKALAVYSLVGNNYYVVLHQSRVVSSLSQVVKIVRKVKKVSL